MMVAPRILDNININIEAGEQVAVLGKIGSGKSTLLRVMARLYQQSSGQLFIDGVDATQVDPPTGALRWATSGRTAACFTAPCAITSSLATRA